MGFPIQRMRRLRTKKQIRDMISETCLHKEDFIYPLFVRPGSNIKTEIPSMPGNYQWTIDLLVKECEEIFSLGISAVILFGIPEKKDSSGSEAYNPRGIIQRALREIKKNVPELICVTDLCLCEYTDHGHCGIIVDNQVDNDKTLDVLLKIALSQAEAGADIIAPSDMMDGRIGSIRKSLDENGFINVPIMAYSAKYASAFYGPFREAADSAPQFGDRAGYQMDIRNTREAMREIELDIGEGADIIMVKPALAYLDIIAWARKRFNIPIAAYNVSGEYSMVKAAGASGWIDEKKVMMEILFSIKRAGADIIITYFAKEAAQMLC